jgi:imidazole glycerol-phosphate synthase subunit HisH
VIAIVDYGAGNLFSVKKAFDHLRADACVTNRAEDLASVDAIVLPGVGHFSALKTLETGGLHTALIDAIHAGKPFLGICLGMQWLFDGSDECREVAGASCLAGSCRRFPGTVRSPHVGWNSLTIKDGSRLLTGLGPSPYVYYTHSFHAPVIAATSGQTEYGLQFSGVVERSNVYGVQFHPEKSGEVGLQILRKFCEISGC